MDSSKYQTVSSSSSEEDEVEIDEKKIETTNFSTETMNEILSKINGSKYNFNNFSSKTCNFIYSEDITENDEVWLMQTPKGIDMTALHDFQLNFEQDVNTLMLKSGKKRKIFNAYSVTSTNDSVNCVLPELKTQSYNLNVLPLAGRIILQEDIEKDLGANMDQTIQSPENSFVLGDMINSTSNHIFNPDLDDIKPSVNHKSSKKRKKYSVL